MRLRVLAGTALASLMGLTLLAGVAQAAPGIVTQGINLRAGPGVDYPWLASLPPGTEAEIFGCLPQWTWCDVETQGLRGWVAGIGLQVLYQDQPEPLVGYGAEIGLPFIGFDFGNYWGEYYRGRPWYSSVDRWHGGGGPGFRPRDDEGPRPDDRRGPPGGFGDGRSFGDGGPHIDPRQGGPAGYGGPGERMPEQARGPMPGGGREEPGRGIERGGMPPQGRPEQAGPRQHGGPQPQGGPRGGDHGPGPGDRGGPDHRDPH